MNAAHSSEYKKALAKARKEGLSPDEALKLAQDAGKAASAKFRAEYQ